MLDHGMGARGTLVPRMRQVMSERIDPSGTEISSLRVIVGRVEIRTWIKPVGRTVFQEVDERVRAQGANLRMPPQVPPCVEQRVRAQTRAVALPEIVQKRRGRR